MTVAYRLRLPDLGEGLTEGEIARWLVREGEAVAEDDPLVEIQTDKTTVEIPSPAAGVVSRILAQEGDVVPVGTVIVVIGGDGGAAAPREDEPVQEAAAHSQPRPEEPAQRQDAPAGPVSRGQSPRQGAPGRVQATPLIRKIARELGVDLASVRGSGPGGRVTDEDVRAAARSEGLSLGLSPGPGLEGRREPLRGVRRLIAEHMTRAHREVAPVTWVEECDFTNVELQRLVATTLKACALALREFPELNARLEGDEIVYLDRYDLGVAVQTEHGLVVPVVRRCDEREVDELDAAVRRLADAARAGTLKPEELRGSTFTVTSAGKLAGLFQTPIVNHPEVAILSIGRIADRPVVRDGEIAVRRIGHVAITFDHRVVDGARAGEFGLAVIRRIESG